MKTAIPFSSSNFALLFIGLTYILGYQVQQTDFYPLIIGYGVFFGAYVWVYRQISSINEIHFFIGVAILLRLILLFSFPNLSDDIYRFIWDGRLINAGVNPFTHLPSYYLTADAPSINGIHEVLFTQLNSPEYFTIYPPICQAVFAIATYLFPENIWASAFIMKLFLVSCEIGSIFLTLKLIGIHQAKGNATPTKAVLLYALNPLILLEISGNLHFEGAMIFFLLAAYFLLEKASSTEKKGFFILSSICFALSVASKLLPLMFLPFLIRYLGWKRSFLYYLIVGVSLLLLFFPLINGVFIANFGDSLDLYFRRFEFNASLYYVARWIGFQFVGYNLIAKIGPFFALLTLVSILTITYKGKSFSWQRLPLFFLAAIMIYLLGTTTVHPWYVSLPIVFCVFTRFRFPIVWSALIFLTYINYSYVEYYNNLWVVALEYLLLAVYFSWEWKKLRVNN